MSLDIVFYTTADGDPFALFARGHFDIAHFRESARGKIREFDLGDEVEKAECGHFWMQSRTADDDDGVDPDFPWYWCEKGAPGAVPVTGVKF